MRKIANSHLRGNNIEIEIKLDTGAMSVALPDHLPSYCDSYPCKVWLLGTWGPLFPGGVPETLPVFAVRKVVGKVNEEEEATYIRISKK